MNTAIAIDFGAIFKALPKKDTKAPAPRVFNKEQPELVDKMAELKERLADITAEYEAIKEKLRQLGKGIVANEITQGNAVMNVTFYGTGNNFANISVRANCRPADALVADNLREHLGSAVDTFLKTTKDIKVKNGKGLARACKKAGIPLGKMADEFDLTKPLPRWPELLAVSGLDPDVIEGVFWQMFAERQDEDGNDIGSLVTAPIVEVNPERQERDA